jgi:curved DNA-binding protein CbpA
VAARAVPEVGDRARQERVIRSYYQILGVAPDATDEEIEKSFRLLARRLHPDLNGGDGATVEMMKELNVARATLTDTAARAAYDVRMRQERGQRRQPTQPQPSRAAPPPAYERPSPSGPPSRFQPGAPAPFLSWGRTRTVDAPAPTPELRRAPHVWRILWFAFAAFMGLTIVLLLIWLRGAFAQ